MSVHLTGSHGAAAVVRHRSMTGFEPPERARTDVAAATEEAAAQALASAATLAEAMPPILAAVCENLGWAWGALWTVDGEGDRLRLDASWHAAASDLAHLDRIGRDGAIGRGDGLPGVVWTSGQPGWTPDVAADDDRALAAAARAAGLRAAFGFPIRLEEEVVGVLEFLAPQVRLLDEALVLMMEALGAQIGAFLAAGDDLDRPERARPWPPRRRVRLSEAEARRMAYHGNTRALLASSLDYDAAIELLPRLAASSLADWCLLELVDGDGRVERVVIAQADEAPTETGGLAPLLVSGVADTALASALPRHDALDLSRRVRTRTLLRVPLRAHGRVLGILTLLKTRAGAAFDGGDHALAEELALMAAIAIDKARLRRDAEQSLRIHDNFLFVSHDLNHPLNVIDLNTKLLGELLATGGAAAAPEPDQSASELGRGLGRIRRATLRMSALLRELRDLAKLQAGEPIELEPTPTDLVALVRQVVDELQRDCTDRTIELEVSVGSLTGRLDRNRIERVLTNLLSNAVKYSRPGSVIHIAVGHDLDPDPAAREAAPDGWAVIEVADSGIGIPASFLPHVFTAFRRADNAAALCGGCGLGLASAYHVVSRHRGTIAVESTEGQGSVFTVRLPL